MTISPLAPYQEQALRRFIKALPPSSSTVLELGSDLEAKVVRRLASLTTCEVVGINPASEFPRVPEGEHLPGTIRLIRTDGRVIPLPDDSIDAVFTVATIEHVADVKLFYAEVRRVLKPGGVLVASFAPIWSSSDGHHTYAVVGAKEARYWKPGRNPIPDFSHLLWSSDEMREFLREGPCDDSLVEPIVEWIYRGDGVNRLSLEEHLRALDGSGLTCERLRLSPGVRPDPETESRLLAKYGVERRFDVAGVEATMRKCASQQDVYRAASRRITSQAVSSVEDFVRSFSPVLRRSRKIRRLLNRRHLPSDAES